MAFLWNRTIVLVLVAALVATHKARAGETAKPERLLGQKYNRGLLIVIEGKPDVYVNMPDHWDVGSPSISPDGSLIAFDANTIGEHPVRESWLLGVDGKGLRKLTNGATPRWSPDGKRLLITRDAEKHTEVHSKSDVLEIDVGSKGERKLCEGRFADWSPDGKQLVLAKGGEITSNGGTHWGSKIYITKPDGSEPQELGEGDWPSWSPDGRKIAYCVHERTPPILWVIDLETKKRTRLGPGFYRSQWAGDSKSLVAKGLLLTDDANNAVALPARFWLDKDRLDFFLMDRDNPWSPCVSRDGKTLVVVADSAGRKKRDETSTEDK